MLNDAEVIPYFMVDNYLGVALLKCLSILAEGRKADIDWLLLNSIIRDSIFRAFSRLNSQHNGVLDGPAFYLYALLKLE